MAPHTDGPGLGWVLSVSIGHSAIFTFEESSSEEEVEEEEYNNNKGRVPMTNSNNNNYTTRQLKNRVRLDSGDILLFDGEKVTHAIDEILLSEEDTSRTNPGSYSSSSSQESTAPCPVFWKQRSLHHHHHSSDYNTSNTTTAVEIQEEEKADVLFSFRRLNIQFRETVVLS